MGFPDAPLPASGCGVRKVTRLTWTADRGVNSDEQGRIGPADVNSMK